MVTMQAHIPRQTTQTWGAGNATGWTVPNTVAGLDAELTPHIPTDANVAVSCIELLSKQVIHIGQNIVIFPLELPQAFAESMSVTETEATTDDRPNKPSNADVERLRDWLLSDSLDWDAVERARHEAW